MITTTEELEFALLSLDPVTAFRASCMPPEIAQLAGSLHRYAPQSVRDRHYQLLRATPNCFSARMQALYDILDAVEEAGNTTFIDSHDDVNMMDFSSETAATLLCFSVSGCAKSGIVYGARIRAGIHAVITEYPYKKYHWLDKGHVTNVNNIDIDILLEILDAWTAI